MTVVACYFFPVQPVVLIVASRSPLVSAHFSISDWRDLMKFKKTILILVSGGTMLQFFGCGSGGNLVVWIHAINQAIQTGHALGLV